MLKLNSAITYFTHLFAYDSLSGLKVNLGLIYAMQSNGPQYKLNMYKDGRFWGKV
jgi:hypothetical protein